MKRLIVLLLVGGFSCPAPTPTRTPLVGCGKDVDCKGDRICVEHQCVAPPATAATPDAGPALDLGGAPDGGVALTFVPVDLSQLGPAPMFHADPAHTGRSRFRAPTSAPKESAALRTGGVVFSSPAVSAGGAVVFGSHDRSVYAIGLDGVVRWKQATADLVWCSPAIGPGNVAYVGSDDDHLYALDLADGAVRWSWKAGPCRITSGPGPEGARCDVDGVTVAADGTIYATADGLYALRPDGTAKWKFSPGVVHCAGAAAVGPDGTVYVGCQDDALYAVDPASGVKRWEFRTQGDIDSPPMVAPDGTIFFGSDDKKLYALTPAGALRFAVVTGGAIRSSPALGPDGTVYVGAADGGLYAVRPSGVVGWVFRAADRIAGSPIVDISGNILFGSADDRLYALTPDGKLLWSYLFDGDVDSTPALAADNVIVIGGDDRALHILRAGKAD